METHFHQLYPHEFFNRISDNSIDKWMETWLVFTVNDSLIKQSLAATYWHIDVTYRNPHH